MSLPIQCVIACILFTAFIIPPLYKNPMSMIMSYPPAIRKRVKSLPQYQDVFRTEKKRQISKKIIAAILTSAILSVVAYFSGATTFPAAFYHVFILFFSVNIFDMLVLDIGIFCHSKKLVIKGTEDMTREYRSPWHHIKGAGIGTVLGAIVSLLSGLYIHLFQLLF